MKSLVPTRLRIRCWRNRRREVAESSPAPCMESVVVVFFPEFWFGREIPRGGRDTGRRDLNLARNAGGGWVGERLPWQRDLWSKSHLHQSRELVFEGLRRFLAIKSILLERREGGKKKRKGIEGVYGRKRCVIWAGRVAVVRSGLA